MFELDDLTSRLDLLRVQPDEPDQSLSLSRSRHRSPSVNTTLSASVLTGSPRAKATAAALSPDVIASAKAALAAERSAGVLKRALLSVRSTPLLNKSASASASSTSSLPLSDLQSAFANGPITGDRLPRPRRPAPPPAAPAPTFSLPADQSFQGFQSVSSPSPSPFGTPTPAFGNPFPPTTPTPAAPQQFKTGGSPLWSLQAPPTMSPFPAFKAPTSISFGTPTITTSPASSTGSASRRDSSRSHSKSVELRAPADVKPPSPSTFDWGVIPQTQTVHVSNFISFGSPSTPTAARPPPAPVVTNGHGQSTTPDESDEGEDEYDEEGSGDGYGDSGDEETGHWAEDSTYPDEPLDTISERSEEE